MDPRVLDAMLPYMTELYGNPHSRTHPYGWESEKAMDEAREVRIFQHNEKKVTALTSSFFCVCIIF
jgi:cysteine sulfinate desulfinase/cysteine desulfurase-like protein